MTDSINFKVNPKIIVSIFRRNITARSKVVMPFCEFDDDIQLNILECLNLRANEVAVILSFTNRDHWLLLTTERLMWCENDEVRHLSNSEIVDVDIVRTSPEVRAFNYKRDGTKIELDTIRGAKLLIDIGESGESYFAFIRALEWTMEKNRES